MRIDLRPATGDDAEAIGRFQTDAWRDSYTGLVRPEYLDSLTPAIRAERWRARLGVRRILLAEAVFEAQEPTPHLVGVASWSPSESPVELNTLYFASSHQGRGLGRRLLDEALGDSPAQLWAFEANARAIAFYERAGFRRTGDRVFDDLAGVHEVRLAR